MKTSVRFFGFLMMCIWAGGAFACGAVTIASMNWQSAELLAHIDKFILSKGYGCDAQVMTGDTVPTLTAMAAKGRPDIAPEASVSQAPGVVTRGLAEQRLIETVNVLPDGYANGWWIPKYIADAHPDIKTIADVFKHPELFPAPEDPSKGAVHSGPQGWGGTVITAQLFKAYEGGKHGFALVPTGSGGALDASLIKAYERKQGWVGFYWKPSSLLGKYEMVRLESGPHDPAEWARCTTIANCPNPKPNDWPAEMAKTLVTAKFARRGGAVMDYLKARQISNEDISAVMSWASDNQASGEDAARYFLRANPSVWNQWVSPEIAAKINKAL